MRVLGRSRCEPFKIEQRDAAKPSILRPIACRCYLLGLADPSRSIERALFVVMERWLQLPCAARGGVLCVALKHKNPAGQACGILESRKPWAAEGSGFLATSTQTYCTAYLPCIFGHRKMALLCRTRIADCVVMH